ncbi:MAG: aldehyde dehydrogenase family protein [Leptonema sp. (in: bacteria)]
MTTIIQEKTLEIININPATGEEINRVPILGKEEVEKLAIRAKSYFPKWSNLSLKERANYLKNLRKEIVKQMDDLVKTICLETGKTEMDGIIEVFTVCEHLQYIIKNGPKFLRDEKKSTGIFIHKKAYISFHPKGVVGVISPWNYPFILTAGPLAQALMAGNAVIVKPSEVTPNTTLKLREIATKAGIPEDVFLVATGDGRTGAALVESKNTDMICFTGSTATGRKIAEICGRMLKPVILELGGKDPMVVFEDADLKRAAKAALWGGISNSGQTCIAVERVIVQESVYEKFLQHLKQELSKIKQGYYSEENSVGSMTFEKQYNIVMEQIQDAKGKGAEILFMGDQNFPNSKGLFIPPTVIGKVTDDMKVWSDETFGPILAIKTFKTEKEAIEIANQTLYGLNGSVWSKNRKRAQNVARQIKSGSICINDVLVNYIISDLPFGGVKESGIGRVYSKEGIRAFTDMQSVVVDRLNLPFELWWFPYTNKIKKLFKHFIKFLFG